MHAFVHCSEVEIYMSTFENEPRDYKSAYETLPIHLIKVLTLLSFTHLEIVSCCAEKDKMWGQVLN